MEFYFFANGIKQQMNLWETFMQSQFFNWFRRNLKTNQIETTAVQGALRPIQLYKYVFPADSLADVLTNMRIANNTDAIAPDPKQPNTAPNAVNPNHPWFEKYLAMMRKLLKLKPVPKIDVNANTIITRPMFVEGVTIIPLGIKEDKIDENEIIGYKQEMI